MMRHAHRSGAAFGLRLCLICAVVIAASTRMMAQRELLPVDHPATRTLVRIYEFGAIPEFPREHLPISRGAALRLLETAARDTSLPPHLSDEAAYYRDELLADQGRPRPLVFIPTDDSSRTVYTRVGENAPLAIIDARDTALGMHVAFVPVLDADVRTDPGASATTIVGQGGAELRGSVLGHVGFSARITNGSVAGDSLLAARDPRIRCNGSFGVTAFGRDLSFGDGHLRADWDAVAIEVGRERIQLGGGLDESLLFGSHLPCNTDYLRLNVHIGRFTFSHVHASLMGEATGQTHGPFAEIPQKYIAMHLLSVGPFAGLRFSLGESVIYHGRGIELGYLNPLVFMKTQEQYLLDRDNANLYAALSWAPINRLFVEGEVIVDDLRFSQIGEGFWNNKTATRLAVHAREVFPGGDVSLSYTRFEPYVFTHFNVLNNYTHAGMVIAGPGMDPNSDLAELRLAWAPFPQLSIDAAFGYRRHGANITGPDSVTGRDTVLYNVGGDVRQTRRAVLDDEHVTFLDGTREDRTQIEIAAEYELIRSVYLRLSGSWASMRTTPLNGTATEITESELRFGLRIGAH